MCLYFWLKHVCNILVRWSSFTFSQFYFYSHWSSLKHVFFGQMYVRNKNMLHHPLVSCLFLNNKMSLIFVSSFKEKTMQLCWNSSFISVMTFSMEYFAQRQKLWRYFFGVSPNIICKLLYMYIYTQSGSFFIFFL